jgi:hypothetical protein
MPLSWSSVFVVPSSPSRRREAPASSLAQMFRAKSSRTGGSAVSRSPERPITMRSAVLGRVFTRNPTCIKKRRLSGIRSWSPQLQETCSASSVEARVSSRTPFGSSALISEVGEPPELLS